MKHLDRVERDLDLLLLQQAGIMDLQQAVQPTEGQPEATAPPAGITKIVQRDAPPRQPTPSMKDIVMHCANSKSDGVRLTNSMHTSLSILLHGKDKRNPIPSLRCAISLQNA